MQKPRMWLQGGIALTVMALALGLGMPSARADNGKQASAAGNTIVPTVPDLRTFNSAPETIDLAAPAPSLHDTQVFYGESNGFTDYDIGTSSTAPNSITSLQGTNLKNDTGILGTSARGSTQQTLTDTGPPALITTNGDLANVPPLKYLKEPQTAITSTDITGAGQTTHSTTSVFSPLITIDNTHLLAGGAANHWTGVQ